MEIDIDSKEDFTEFSFDIYAHLCNMSTDIDPEFIQIVNDNFFDSI